EMADEKFTVFLLGVFSQWFRNHPFTVDGVTYNCAEQYMMAEKARLFKDEVTRQKIMAADHPKEQKALGREVKGFIKSEWDKV
ncbi:NADAR family protein, partial [Acinetobacter baumannii]